MTTGKFEGAPPPVDLDAERRVGDFVRALIVQGMCRTVHDLSDGGLLVALAEMALAGNTGLDMASYGGPLPYHAAAFGEDQGRYLLGIAPEFVDSVIERANDAGIPIRVIGKAGGEAISLAGEASITLARLRDGHEEWFPAFFGENQPGSS
jgi:phosphoribosylformylglycinamidine synthase subunit PurL